MSIRHAIPVLAALALVACGSNADEELQAEGLAAEEVDGTIAADFPMPRPGQYRTTQELVAFAMPGLTQAQMDMARSAFAEGAAAETTTVCVTETNSREQWLSDMVESDCTVSRNATQGSAIDLVLSCQGAEGVTGRVAMTGTATQDGSDMEMTFTQAVPGMGEGTITMKLASERVGDCA